MDGCPLSANRVPFWSWIRFCLGLGLPCMLCLCCFCVRRWLQGQATVIIGLLEQLRSVYKYKAATAVKAGYQRVGAAGPSGIAVGLKAGLLKPRA